MTDNELLLALSDMIDKKLDAKLQPLQKGITDIKSDVTNMQDDITDIKVYLIRLTVILSKHDSKYYVR